MTNTLTLDTALDIVKNNPHSGSTNNIVTLSLTISQSKKTLDKSIYNIFTEKSNISKKIFSNLKKIGDTLLEIPEDIRNEIVKSFPPSYRSIYHLCSLKSKELITAVKSKNISKDISYRQAVNYVKQVKHPQVLATDGDKGRWSTKQEHLWSIFRTDYVYLGGEKLTSFEEQIRRVCRDYGLILRKPSETKISVLREEERRERAAFWRRILEAEITQSWFLKQDEKLKKQFNIRSADELRDTPMRQFTGFIINAVGGRENFWKLHGQAYIAKCYYLLETAEDAANRYNHRKRIESVLGDRFELAVWRNTIWKQSGFI